jgi:hypothetical protein
VRHHRRNQEDNSNNIFDIQEEQTGYKFRFLSPLDDSPSDIERAWPEASVEIELLR